MWCQGNFFKIAVGQGWYCHHLKSSNARTIFLVCCGARLLSSSFETKQRQGNFFKIAVGQGWYHHHLKSSNARTIFLVCCGARLLSSSFETKQRQGYFFEIAVPLPWYHHHLKSCSARAIFLKLLWGKVGIIIIWNQVMPGLLVCCGARLLSSSFETKQRQGYFFEIAVPLPWYHHHLKSCSARAIFLKLLWGKVGIIIIWNQVMPGLFF